MEIGTGKLEIKSPEDQLSQLKMRLRTLSIEEIKENGNALLPEFDNNAVKIAEEVADKMIDQIENFMSVESIIKGISSGEFPKSIWSTEELLAEVKKLIRASRTLLTAIKPGSFHIVVGPLSESVECLEKAKNRLIRRNIFKKQEEQRKERMKQDQLKDLKEQDQLKNLKKQDPAGIRKTQIIAIAHSLLTVMGNFQIKVSPSANTSNADGHSFANRVLTTVFDSVFEGKHIAASSNRDLISMLIRKEKEIRKQELDWMFSLEKHSSPEELESQRQRREICLKEIKKNPFRKADLIYNYDLDLFYNRDPDFIDNEELFSAQED